MTATARLAALLSTIDYGGGMTANVLAARLIAAGVRVDAGLDATAFTRTELRWIATLAQTKVGPHAESVIDKALAALAATTPSQGSPTDAD
jgi:hypothetical protein